MKIQTAERVSRKDLSDNFVFQRSILAYLEASKIVSGNVLEIGAGNGYGVPIIAPRTNKYTTIDKYDKQNENIENVEFIKMNIPPLIGLADNSYDFVIAFQVIEHIENDKEFVKEIYRVLKPNGKLIVTTPNKKMSLTRNPWHIREYTISELDNLLMGHFKSVKKMGVFGNSNIMEYYNLNKLLVKKITRFDIFNLQYELPRYLLQLPYDIFNRINRKKLLKNNTSLVSQISIDDYYMKDAIDDCFDLFFVSEKTTTPIFM